VTASDGAQKLLTRLCPACGREVKTLYNGLCEECFKASHRLLEPPHQVEVTLCKLCGSYKLEGEWRRPRTDNPLGEAVREVVSRSGRVRGKVLSLSVDVSGAEGGLARIRVLGTFSEGVTPYEEEYEVQLRVRWDLCTQCTLTKSKREAARVQVRAQGRPLEPDEILAARRIVERSLATRWRGSLDLIEVIETEGGVDFVFSSLPSAKLAASALSRELFSTLLETRKSAGVVSGRRVARHTLRVLVPGFRAGDIIEYDGTLHYVLEVSRSGVRALDLRTYKERLLSKARPLIERSRVVVRREELEDAVVAYAIPGEVGLVLLRSQKSLPVRMIDGLPWLKVGDRVLVASVAGRAFVLPPVHRAHNQNIPAQAP